MLMGAHEQLLTRSSKGPEYLLMGAHEQLLWDSP